MRRINGFGGIMKLGGKRRKPYAIRITDGWINGKQKFKYLSYHETLEEAEMTLNDYIKFGKDEWNINPKCHLLHDTRIYRIWAAMIRRCENSKDVSYRWYGAKGIKVCEEWKNSFQKFYNWSICHGYKDDLTIDRIDNDSNYEPSNCRWVTLRQQAQNHYHSKENII